MGSNLFLLATPHNATPIVSNIKTSSETEEATTALTMVLCASDLSGDRGEGEGVRGEDVKRCGARGEDMRRCGARGEGVRRCGVRGEGDSEQQANDLYNEATLQTFSAQGT